MADKTFAELQAQFRSRPSVTLRSIGDVEGRSRGGDDPAVLHDDGRAGAREALQLPIYGCDPALNPLGSKTGSRQVFAEEDVPHPVGLEVRGWDDLPGALDELRARSPSARRAVLKLDSA